MEYVVLSLLMFERRLSDDRLVLASKLPCLPLVVYTQHLAQSVETQGERRKKQLHAASYPAVTATTALTGSGPP